MRKIKQDLNKWNNVLVNLVLILQRFWFSQNWGIIKLSPWNSQYVFGNWQAYFKFYINMQGIMSSSPEFLSQNSVRLTFNALKLPFHELTSLLCIENGIILGRIEKIITQIFLFSLFRWTTSAEKGNRNFWRNRTKNEITR